MSKNWVVKKSEIVFDDKWFKVQKDTVLLPNGETTEFFMWPEGDVATIVPVTEKRELILVKQYKHAIGKEVIEFPAGVLSKEEDSLKGAQRELLEETGIKAKKWFKIASLSHHPTKVMGNIICYVAAGLEFTEQTHFDPTENITTIKMTLTEVEEAIYTGKIIASPTISCFFLTCLQLSTAGFVKKLTS